MFLFLVIKEWKGINRKQSTRWQHLSRLKANAFFCLQIFLVVMKHSNLYLGLVLPSCGWQSLIIFQSAMMLKIFKISIFDMVMQRNLSRIIPVQIVQDFEIRLGYLMCKLVFHYYHYKMYSCPKCVCYVCHLRVILKSAVLLKNLDFCFWNGDEEKFEQDYSCLNCIGLWNQTRIVDL